MNKNKKVSKKPTLASLAAALEKSTKANGEFMNRIASLLKENEELKKATAKEEEEEVTEFNADDLCLNIKYKKDESSKAQNYYGKLVNAFINHTTGARYFHLLGEDNQTRIFRKDKTENADEVQAAVEKLYALRRAAAEADRFAA